MKISAQNNHDAIEPKKFYIAVVVLFFLLVNQASIAQSLTSKFDDAMKYYDGKNYAEALNKFIEIQPADLSDNNLFSSTKFYAADCLIKLGQINRAILFLEEFTNNYKFSSLRPLALYKLGTEYYNMKEYERSSQKLLLLIKDYPYSRFLGSSYFFIGDSYLKQHMYYDAEEYLGLAVSNSNTNSFISNCIYSLGSLYEFRNNYSKAVSYYDELLTYHKSSELAPLAQLRIGVAYFKLKEYDSAVLELTDPLISKLTYRERSEALFILANSYIRLKQYNNAAEIYNKILSKAKTGLERDDVKFGLAWIEFQVNNFDKAYKIFTDLRNSIVDSIKIKSIYWSAESKRYAGEIDDAIKIYKDFLKTYKNNDYSDLVKFGLATIYYKQKNNKESEYSLLAALGTNDSNLKCKIYTLLGEISLERKKYKSAGEYFNSALNIKEINDANKQHAQLGLAVSNYFLNSFNNSIKILTEITNAKNINVDMDKVNYFLAESYFALGRFEDAIEKYNIIVSSDTSLIRQTLYGKAYSYFNNKDYINAEYFFRTYVKKYKNIGNYYNALLRLADSYYGTKEFDKSVGLYEKLFSNKLKLKLSDFSYYQYGQALYKAGNSDGAIKKLTELQEKFTKSKYTDDAQYIIAWIYFKQKKYSAAIDEYLKLLEKYPATPLRPIIYYSIADSYFNQESYENAISYYAKVIDDFPNSTYVEAAVSGIQYCYLAKDQTENAINFIKQFVINNPNSKYSDKVLLKKGEIYFSNENYKASEESYNELIEKYPNSIYKPEAHYWVGKSAAMLGENETAVSNFLRVISLSVKSDLGVAAALETSKIYRNQGEYFKAIELLNDVIAKIPKSPRVAELLFKKAQIQLDLNSIAEAFSTFNQIIYYYDETVFGAKAKIEMGIIELSRKSFENAEILFKELADKRMDDLGAKAQYYYGITLLQQDKIDDAISAFVRVQSLFSQYTEWNSKSLLGLGDCYVKLGNNKKAKNIFRKVYKAHKNDRFGAEAKTKLNKL